MNAKRTDYPKQQTDERLEIVALPFWNMPWIRGDASGRIPSFDVRSPALYDSYLTNICYEHLNTIFFFTNFCIRSLPYHLFLYEHLLTSFRHTIFCPTRSSSYESLLTNIWYTGWPHKNAPSFVAHRFLLVIGRDLIFCPQIEHSILSKTASFGSIGWELLIFYEITKLIWNRHFCLFCSKS